MSSPGSLVMTRRRQLHVADVELVAEHERRHIVLDLGRELARQSSTVRVCMSCSSMPPCETPSGWPSSEQADLGLNRLVGADAHEVDVREGALHRVALDLAGQGELAAPVDLELDERVGTGRDGEDAAELASPRP